MTKCISSRGTILPNIGINQPIRNMRRSIPWSSNRCLYRSWHLTRRVLTKEFDILYPNSNSFRYNSRYLRSNIRNLNIYRLSLIFGSPQLWYINTEEMIFIPWIYPTYVSIAEYFVNKLSNLLMNFYFLNVWVLGCVRCRSFFIC